MCTGGAQLAISGDNFAISVDDEKILKKGVDGLLCGVARASRNLASQRGETESKETSTSRTGRETRRFGGNLEAGDTARQAGSVSGSIGRSGQVERAGDLRIADGGETTRSGELVDLRIDGAARSSGWTSWWVFGSTERCSRRLRKPADLRISGAAQPSVGSAQRALGQTRVGKAGSADRRASRWVFGSAGRFRRTWGPVISYMTGPHTYVCPNCAGLRANPW